MKILADENMDAGIIEWLRAQGEDLLSIWETMRGPRTERFFNERTMKTESS